MRKNERKREKREKKGRKRKKKKGKSEKKQRKSRKNKKKARKSRKKRKNSRKKKEKKRNLRVHALKDLSALGDTALHLDERGGALELQGDGVHLGAGQVELLDGLAGVDDLLGEDLGLVRVAFVDEGLA